MAGGDRIKCDKCGKIIEGGPVPVPFLLNDIASQQSHLLWPFLLEQHKMINWLEDKIQIPKQRFFKCSKEE